MDVPSYCLFLLLACDELMGQMDWTSTCLLPLPSSSVNCKAMCRMPTFPYCASRGAEEHRLQPGIPLCQRKTALPMA